MGGAQGGLFCLACLEILHAGSGLQREGATSVFSGLALDLLVTRLFDALEHVHGVVFQQRRVRNQGDVKPTAVFDDELSQGLKVEVRFLDLGVKLGVATAVLNA